jgi:hypothetical protein
MDGVDAAEAIDGGGFHRLWKFLGHDTLPMVARSGSDWIARLL